VEGIPTATSGELISIEAFSVEDSCAKPIEGLGSSSLVASLIEKVRYEFAIVGAERLKFVCGELSFSEDDSYRTLRDLGIRQGSVVSFDLLDDTSFSVMVVDLAGRQFLIPDLVPSMSLAELVVAVQRVACQPEEAARLIMGTRAFNTTDLGKSLESLGLREASQLTLVKRLQPTGSCPGCCSLHVATDVTIGATHEGWGRRWNRCQYDCLRCGVKITSEEKVSACHSCKGFWHRSCKLASWRPIE